MQSIEAEARRVFRGCSNNPFLRQVPFDVWLLIVFETDLLCASRMMITCKGFKQMMKILSFRDVSIAKSIRQNEEIEKAKFYLLRAGLSNGEACFHIGYAYFTGGGWGFNDRENKTACDSWFKKGAENGNFSAMAYHAYCLLYRKKSDEPALAKIEANLWAKRVFSSNDSFAKGSCYLFGVCVEKDSMKARECFEASAKEGDEYGQLWLGICYKINLGVSQSLTQAIHWFSQSAQQGSASAQYRLGCMYKNDKKDVYFDWISKAADQGFIEALRERNDYYATVII